MNNGVKIFRKFLSLSCILISRIHLSRWRYKLLVKRKHICVTIKNMINISKDTQSRYIQEIINRDICFQVEEKILVTVRE